MPVSPAQAAGAQPPAPLGIVYDTAMDRPDAALGVAAVYALADKREAHLGAICVDGAGLKAAIFCDIVGRFFVAGPERNGNQALAVGLADVSPLPPDAPMFAAVVDKKASTGEPQYVRGVARVVDTSQAEAVLRNGVTFNAEGVAVLSAPATSLARSLDLLGTKALYQTRVKRLVIVDAGVPQRDPAALRTIIAEWPAPIVFCGREIGEALRFPGARLDALFGWSPAHPVADAYRAYAPMPYDAPMHDVAALHYAVHPDSGWFDLSEPGTLSVAGDGRVSFAPGAGQVRRLVLNPSKAHDALEALLALVSAAPTPPPARSARGKGAA